MSLPNQPFNADEMQRYSRHFTLPSFGLEGQLKLKQARVLCVGAGGLGSPALLYLAAAGVGKLGIIDNDKVDLSNLQRQVLYCQHDQGCNKALAAKSKLAALNPNIKFQTYQEALTYDNALTIINDYDIVIDGTDNFATRYLINDACFHLKKPNVYASVFRFEGQCSVFNFEQGPCYRCLYADPPPQGLIPNCAEGGVLGVLPGIMGAIQANEVIKLITGIGEPLIGRLLTLDALTMRFQEYPIQRHPTCRLCVQQQTFAELPRYQPIECGVNMESNFEITAQELAQLLQQKNDIIILDVREPYEYQICNINGKLLPLSELPQRIDELDKNKQYIVHCKLGMRSQQAMMLLKAAGFKSVRHLKGGIMAWIEEIDPTMMRY